MSAVTAFLDDVIVAEGDREKVQRLLEERYAADLAAIRVFENEGGRVTDLDYWHIPPHSSPERGGGPSAAWWRGPGEGDRAERGGGANPPRYGEGDQPEAGGGVAPRHETTPRSRGRPRLGVTAREITLLPRHWDWLAGQPGGASAALRRLVEEARRAPPSPAAARDAACRFMGQMCGDRPGYEEAVRALYRGEADRFEALIAAWPADVRAYIARLLAP